MLNYSEGLPGCCYACLCNCLFSNIFYMCQKNLYFHLTLGYTNEWHIMYEVLSYIGITGVYIHLWTFNTLIALLLSLSLSLSLTHTHTHTFSFICMYMMRETAALKRRGRWGLWEMLFISADAISRGSLWMRTNWESSAAGYGAQKRALHI